MTLPFATVAEELEAARTRRELIEASQMIQHVDGIDYRERLGAIVKRRIDEFKNK